MISISKLIENNVVMQFCRDIVASDSTESRIQQCPG